MPNRALKVTPFASLAAKDRERRHAEVRRIFFATAFTSAFSSAQAREAYWRRWCGGYFDLWPDYCLLALAEEDGPVLGYLAGCPDSFASRAEPVIADIFYYTPVMLAGLRALPAHLHVNVAPGYQSGGTGSALVRRFFGMCRDGDCPGAHVVTAREAEAGRFFLSCGFALKTSFEAESRWLSLYEINW
jgi:GNAT superfamily N-acetyltransferase